MHAMRSSPSPLRTPSRSSPPLGSYPARLRRYSAVYEPSASSNSRGVLLDSTSPPARTPPIRMRGAGLGKASMLATPCTASRCTENRCPRGSPGIPVSLLTFSARAYRRKELPARPFLNRSLAEARSPRKASHSVIAYDQGQIDLRSSELVSPHVYNLVPILVAVDDARIAVQVRSHGDRHSRIQPRIDGR